MVPKSQAPPWAAFLKEEPLTLSFPSHSRGFHTRLWGRLSQGSSPTGFGGGQTPSPVTVTSPRTKAANTPQPRGLHGKPGWGSGNVVTVPTAAPSGTFPGSSGPLRTWGGRMKAHPGKSPRPDLTGGPCTTTSPPE